MSLVIETLTSLVPLTGAMGILGATVFVAARLSVREYRKLEQRLDAVQAQQVQADFSPITTAVEDVMRRLAALEAKIEAESQDTRSRTVAQLFDLSTHVRDLRSDMETINNEQSVNRAIEMAQNGASADTIHRVANVSLVEAEALIRFHAGRKRGVDAPATAN